MSQKCKLLERGVQIKEQVSEAVARRLQIRCTLIFHKLQWKKYVLESLPNKVAGLNVCNSIKKRLQQRCFLVNFAKFVRTPFFTEQLQWLLLRFSKESGIKSGATVSKFTDKFIVKFAKSLRKPF